MRKLVITRLLGALLPLAIPVLASAGDSVFLSKANIVFNGISADGSVVVGTSSSGGQQSAMRFVSGNYLDIGGGTGSYAYSANADGSIIAGQGAFPMLGSHAFIWKKVGGYAASADSNGFGASNLSGITPDGLNMCGYGFMLSSGNADYHALRMVNGTFYDLHYLGTGNQAFANGISDNGSTVVGTSNTTPNGIYKPFVWKVTSGIQPLPLTHESGSATAISGDGKIIVGYFNDAADNNIPHACLWNSQGFVSLGHLDGNSTYSKANACNGNGSVVVGRSTHFGLSKAFIWTPEDGMLDLQDYLKTKGVTFAPGVELIEAKGISADGSKIVGTAYNTLGNSVSFIATVNLNPVAVGDSYLYNVGSALTIAAPGVLKNDNIQPNSTAVLVSGPAYESSFNLFSDGSFTYKPVAGYTGADSFTYKIVTPYRTSNTVTVKLAAPVPLKVTLVKPTLVGGQTTTATVYLTGPVHADTVVALSSDKPAAASVPMSATVLGNGSYYRSFVATSHPVAASTLVTINPATLLSLGISPSTVSGGTAATATVTLNGAAPSGGASITVTSDHPLIASGSSPVVIPAGLTTKTFAITTHPSPSTVVTITVHYLGQILSKTITVGP
jgi:probable HAF family extracellular repeat protein